jgi:hypothetical protein
MDPLFDRRQRQRKGREDIDGWSAWKGRERLAAKSEIAQERLSLNETQAQLTE